MHHSQISLADLRRRSIEVVMAPRRPADRPWLRVAGALSSGDPDASVSVHEVVHVRPQPIA